MWAIDHTRAFRTQNTLPSAANITRCDRQVLPRLKQLNKDVLKREIGEFVSDYQIAGLLARRDQIVAIIEKAGPAACSTAGPMSRRRGSRSAVPPFVLLQWKTPGTCNWGDLALAGSAAVRGESCPQRHACSDGSCSLGRLDGAFAPSAQERDRLRIPDRFKWDLTDIYPTDAAWREAKEKLAPPLPRLREFQGQLATSPAEAG